MNSKHEKMVQKKKRDQKSDSLLYTEEDLEDGTIVASVPNEIFAELPPRLPENAPVSDRMLFAIINVLKKVHHVRDADEILLKNEQVLREVSLPSKRQRCRSFFSVIAARSWMRSLVAVVSAFLSSVIFIIKGYCCSDSSYYIVGVALVFYHMVIFYLVAPALVVYYMTCSCWTCSWC